MWLKAGETWEEVLTTLAQKKKEALNTFCHWVEKKDKEGLTIRLWRTTVTHSAKAEPDMNTGHNPLVTAVCISACVRLPRKTPHTVQTVLPGQVFVSLAIVLGALSHFGADVISETSDCDWGLWLLVSAWTWWWDTWLKEPLYWVTCSVDSSLIWALVMKMISVISIYWAYCRLPPHCCPCLYFFH